MEKADTHWLIRAVLHSFVPALHWWVQMTPGSKTCRLCGAWKKESK